jgi:hypothetical protein
MCNVFALIYLHYIKYISFYICIYCYRFYAYCLIIISTSANAIPSFQYKRNAYIIKGARGSVVG